MFDAAARTWTFDLTFAVQAWTEGTDGDVLPNQGIMLRPVGAPNLAYGDPDFSTNWQVSLADSTATDLALRPRVRYETVSDETGAVIDPGGFVDLPTSLVDDGGLDSGLIGGVPSDGGGSGGDLVRPPKPRVHRPQQRFDSGVALVPVTAGADRHLPFRPIAYRHAGGAAPPPRRTHTPGAET